MHVEVLVEDSSGCALIESLLPRVIGEFGSPHTWRVHAYKDIGRVPQGLGKGTDPAKRILLDRLPRILTGYGRSSGVDAVVVVVDTDQRDCRAFLTELMNLLERCRPAPNALFRLAIEEIESWLLGDRAALKAAYPRLRVDPLGRYRQDAVCGTWELLADAVQPGGRAALFKGGWPAVGSAKHEWARRIAPHMDIERNASPSFGKFRDGLRRLVATP